MKVLHVIAGAPTGGAETFCLDAISALHESGVDQHVVCRPHKRVVERLENLQIPHDCISFNRLLKPLEARQIKKLVANTNADLVHAWMNRASSFIPSGLQVPVLGWFGGYYDLKNYKNCDFYMGVTRDIAKHIIEKSNKPQRTFLIHTFGTLKQDKLISKKEFNIPENAQIILLLSRMHVKKGIDTLLIALQSLSDDVYCLLAGDGPELETYKLLATDLGIDHRVRFLGWREDRQALLALADVCVLPSRYEPFGTVIAEAWFAGVPLVATKADGAMQYVEDRVNGLLCEIDDPAQLAGLLQEALADQDLQVRLTEGGKKQYQDLFSRDVVTRDLISSYREMINVFNKGGYLVDEEEYGFPSLERDHIEQLILEKCGNFINEKLKKKAILVAKCYIKEFTNIDIATDAALIEAKGIFDFIEYKNKRTMINIMTEIEINRIMKNYKEIMS